VFEKINAILIKRNGNFDGFMFKMHKNKTRCAWVTDNPIYIQYHDKEWGMPIYDDRLLFEFLILEGAQAGLSWLTILKRRENYRVSFDNFDAKKIANYNKEKIQKLLKNEGIIRNHLKIHATITNARVYLAIQKKYPSFAHYIWQFVEGKPIQNHFNSNQSAPTSTPISDKMSKDLKKQGFKFVGTTICYAFMQAVGMVNDHATDCFRHLEIKRHKHSKIFLR
jgi:DNA-3-methyladenine glycosylase I